MPLSVYLDSSDFSVFARREVSGEFRKVREALELWLSTGEIQLVFSNVHVAEASAVTRDALPMSQARLRTIDALCGPHAMVHSSDLMEDEIDRLYGMPAVRAVLRHDGYWLPTEMRNIHFPSLNEMIEEIIAEAPTPVMRDQVRLRLFTSAGKLTSKASAEILRRVPRFIRELRAKLPVTQDVERAIWRHFRDGSTDPREPLRQLAAQLQDLPTFAVWQEQDWEGAGQVTMWLRDAGKKLATDWQRVANEVARKAAENYALGISDEEFAAIGRKVMTLWRATAVPKMAQALSKRATPPLVSDAARAEEVAPSVSTVTSVQLEMAWHSIRPTGKTRQPQPSDFGDITHTLYLPHVDVFRADRFSAHIIRACLPNLGERVVETLVELPAAIERKLLSPESAGTKG